MRPAAFDYVAPASLQEALVRLSEVGDEGKVLAGGQSLLPLMRLRLAKPRLLIDINGLTGLDQLRVEDGELRIGALTRHRKLETEVLDPGWQIISLAARNVAHLPIRLRGTFGGSIAHADPAAELPLVVNTLGGRLFLSNRDRDRVVDSSDFFKSFFTTDLRPDEILTEVRIPAPPAGSRSAFVEFNRRPGDFAVVAAAVVAHFGSAGTCDWCRIGLAGVAGTPHRVSNLEQLLLSQRFDEALIDTSVESALAGFEPVGDIHADTKYRAQLSRVLLKRALCGVARASTTRTDGSEMR